MYNYKLHGKKLNPSPAQIRKKLAALSREEEKIAEEERKKAETAAAEDAKQKAEAERKKKELEKRNIAIAAAGKFVQSLCLLRLTACKIKQPRLI